MPQHHSVFHALLKLIPWPVFHRLVREHDGDAGVRRFTRQQHLIALVFARLAGAHSLREVEAALSSHHARLKPVGLSPVARSTLADANAQRPWAVFTGLLAHLIDQAVADLPRSAGEMVRLIDSTTLRLSEVSQDWARFSPTSCAAKLHGVFDPQANTPLQAEVNPATVNDITPAKSLPIEPGATSVYDLGFYDYGWWAHIDVQGARFVTRLKKNTPLHGVRQAKVAPGSAILADRIGHLPQRQARSRRNPFQDPVREVQVRAPSGTVLRILSNDLDAPAAEIAELYKRRWTVEMV